MPDDSDVRIGLIGVDLLSRLREEAEVCVPPTIPFPPGVDRIPFITRTPGNHDFRGVTDRLWRAKPIGATVIERMEGPMLTIIGERAGFVILQDRPSARVWKENIQNSDGAHVLIITDQDINEQEPDRPGRIYGLFECMLRGGGSQVIET